MKQINLDSIRQTDRLQPRVSINYLVVDDYANSMQDNSPFPPIELVFDGINYWMWDGFHRFEAAKKIGIDSINSNVIDGTLQDAEWLCLSANKGHGLHRTNEDKRRAVMLALKHPYSTNGKSKSNREIAKHCGVSQPFVSGIVQELTNDNRYHKFKNSQTKTSPTEKILPEVREIIDGTQVADNQKDLQELARVRPKDQVEIVNLVLSGVSNTIKQAKKELKRLRRLENRQSSKIEIPQDSPVWHGDFRIVGNNIPDNSVDLIFTDPPYNENAIQLYRDLGVFAKRVLKPGGLCLAYSGQIFLPQVLNALSENLEYVWCFAIKHNGAYTRIFKTKVNNAWKPVVMYCKLPYEVWWQQIIDLVEDKIDKEDHEWQQSTNSSDYYLDKLCPKNGFIVDPFCGSGTTLVSAKQLGLKYIGIEDDIEDVERTINRLNDIK